MHTVTQMEQAASSKQHEDFGIPASGSWLPASPPSYGRRSYGRQRKATPVQRARYIAESILLHEAEGRVRTFSDYGIDSNPLMVRLVAAWLTRLGR